MLRRSEASEPFSTRDLVGDEAFVGVGIPAGRYGSVIVKAEGQTHEFSATAVVGVPGGDHRPVTGVAGDRRLIVGARPAQPTGPAVASADPVGRSGGSHGA